MEEPISAPVTDGYPGGPTGIDPSVPNVARIYDYWLGGRENFQADRAAAEQLLKLVPEAGDAARDNQAFLHRAVRFLAEQGITQFLDIGTGMPGPDTILDTARKVNPECRVAYVDYDPVVVSHCRAMLTKSPQAIVVQADIRQPEALLRRASVREHLDFGKPVAVLLMAVLHFVSDDDDPAAIMAVIGDALAPGSYVLIGHANHEDAPDSMVSGALATFARTSARLWPRTADEIRGLFDGFDLLEPGLVPAHMWRPDADGPPARELSVNLCGLARKA